MIIERQLIGNADQYLGVVVKLGDRYAIWGFDINNSQAADNGFFEYKIVAEFSEPTLVAALSKFEGRTVFITYIDSDFRKWEPRQKTLTAMPCTIFGPNGNQETIDLTHA